MINGLNRVKEFGVFKNYTKPVDTECFAEKNIIYGWNYSGKTTVSRIFHSLELGEIHNDFRSASFEISCSDGKLITEHNLPSFVEKVRVFNSDFIVNNLSWEGGAFDPILLLGDDSIEAEKTIKLNDIKIERCRSGYSIKRGEIATIEKTIKDAKTMKASQIKKTLSLVEAFTATHLNQLIPVVEKAPESYLQEKEKYKCLLKQSLASESDKLPLIECYFTKGNVSASIQGVSELLLKIPEMANTISYLAENSNVSRWIKEGLELHEDKDICEFCGNALEFERLRSLKSHFSKDLSDHENKIKDQIRTVEQLKIDFNPKHVKDFYPDFGSEVKKGQSDLNAAIKHHNSQIQMVIDALNIKLNSQYKPLALPDIDNNCDKTIKIHVDKLNEIVKQNNDITNNFSKEKQGAINALKKHYAAEFVTEVKLEAVKRKQHILEQHKNKYESVANKTKLLNLELEAKISNAQKGREELNQFIEKFLGDSNIRIEVIKDNEKERFILMRGDDKAKNLSEGEKTAIAFSFFLVKLWELNALDESIIYIDDPVSSLDSNHLFQVNAVIKDFFFWQDAANGNEWKLKVKQIFFSTHNFEFLSLLKELPMGSKSKTKYFLVKRIPSNISILVNMPESIKRYSSEYHYLWSLIYTFHINDNKDNIEFLLSLPNAMRRFIELYTYSKIPSSSLTTVDNRADILFGTENSKRIMKVLHHFSHLNNINRMSQNNDLMSDIENVVKELVEHVQNDELHYNALMESIECV